MPAQLDQHQRSDHHHRRKGRRDHQRRSAAEIGGVAKAAEGGREPRHPGRASLAMHVCRGARFDRKITSLTPDLLAATPSAAHPIARRNPDNGRTGLYLSPNRVTGISGMPDGAPLRQTRGGRCAASESLLWTTWTRRPGAAI
jgi:hypothetical protein